MPYLRYDCGFDTADISVIYYDIHDNIAIDLTPALIPYGSIAVPQNELITVNLKNSVT